MKKITIENLKSITKLEFVIPPPGIHVLTGINGSGKTTLIACLQRLTDSYAFQRHFRTTSNLQFDNFRSSIIRFENNGSHVEYRYRNTRWVPTPRAKASLLNTMGFSNAILISSAGERFYVQNEELDTRGIVAAPNFLREGMNDIFQTSKYSELRRKKLNGRGLGHSRSNYGFLMPAATVAGQKQYYTEKNFSLGEVLILNALFQLENISDNSLVLIDEIELALHPKVQVRFLKFLERLAQAKNLTVILSTHSSSLIRQATNLIYLERNSLNGLVTVEYKCFAALALQNMAIQDEIIPDLVLFVEDEYANYILEHLLNYYFINLNNRRRPVVKMLPIGGWPQTLRFTVSSAQYLLPANTPVIAFLDHDALPSLQVIRANVNRKESEQQLLNTYDNNIQKIKFLPITPELGIYNLLAAEPHVHIRPIQELFNEPIDISQILEEETRRGLNYSDNARKAAKERLKYIVDTICARINKDENYVKRRLSEYFAEVYCPANHPALHETFGPLFGRN